MADGTTQPIDQVKVGDKITNAQPNNPTTQVDTVTAIHITYTDHDYDQLTITTPTGPATITSTAEHPYWDTTTHTWTPADNLNPGNQLDTPDNHHTTITATHHYTALQTTYNLTINNVHTYYVTAGTTPVLVHNDSCDISAQREAELGSMLSKANANKGDFGIGSGTVDESQLLGEAWVGPEYTVHEGGSVLISSDGLRQYRLPSFKPNNPDRFGEPMYQSNFESRLAPKGQWQSDGHFDITGTP